MSLNCTSLADIITYLRFVRITAHGVKKYLDSITAPIMPPELCVCACLAISPKTRVTIGKSAIFLMIFRIKRPIRTAEFTQR